MATKIEIMSFICDCEECQILKEMEPYAMASSGRNESPFFYDKYEDNDELESAHQQGKLAGLRFKYNELVGDKVFQ